MRKVNTATAWRPEWDDDLYAPRQEYDALAALHEEAWIQRRLAERDDLSPANYLRSYQEAQEEYRDHRLAHPPTDDELSELIEMAQVFGRQAASVTGSASSRRYFVSFICPDCIGVVAAVTTRLADAGANIEGAYMAVIAGQLLMAFILSGPEDGAAERLENEIRTSLADFGPVQPAVVPMHAAPLEWPRPNSSIWHVTVRQPQHPSYLTTVTQAVAREELPLVALSYWTEDGGDRTSSGLREVVDLNIAIAPRLDEDKTLRSLAQTLSAAAPDATVDLAPVEWPTRIQPEGGEAARGRTNAVLTVLGHAQPGFVATSLATISSRLESFRVQGATMAILEGASVLIVMLEAPRAFLKRPGAVETDLQEALRRAVTEAGHAAPVTRLRFLHEAGPKGRAKSGRLPQRDGETMPDTHQTTHALHLEVIEQPRVISKVAAVMRDHDVNITWLVSYVLEPTLGQKWPRCTLEMHVHINDEKTFEAVDSKLKSLAEAERWTHIRLRPWSLGALGTGVSGQAGG